MNTDLDLISLIFVCKNVIVLSSFDIILGTLWLSLVLLSFVRMYKTHFFTIFLCFPCCSRIRTDTGNYSGKDEPQPATPLTQNEEEGAYVVGVGVSAYDGRFSFFFLPLFGVVPKERGKGAWKRGIDSLRDPTHAKGVEWVSPIFEFFIRLRV